MKKKIGHPPPASFCFVSPDGVIHKGVNIRKFAREQGLDPANMQHVHDGERLHHKGWTYGGEI